jgi:HAMP domain-containing protein
MANIYAPVMRALVAVALLLATATLMFVAVNTARAARAASDAQSAAPFQATDIQGESVGLAAGCFLL